MSDTLKDLEGKQWSLEEQARIKVARNHKVLMDAVRGGEYAKMKENAAENAKRGLPTDIPISTNPSPAVEGDKAGKSTTPPVTVIPDAEALGANHPDQKIFDQLLRYAYKEVLCSLATSETLELLMSEKGIDFTKHPGLPKTRRIGGNQETDTAAIVDFEGKRYAINYEFLIQVEAWKGEV